MKTLRIADVIVTPIALGDPPLLNASGLHAPFALRVILEIVAESGETGIAELPGGVDLEAALIAMGKAVRGMDAFRLTALLARVAGAFSNDSNDRRGQNSWDERIGMHVLSGLEIACLDLQGKTLGCRVADLIGGPVRESVPYAAYLFFKYDGIGGDAVELNGSTGWAAGRARQALDPAGIVTQAYSMIEAFGFHSVKLKGGILPPETEVGSILALREALPADVPLRFDPNAVWSPATARKWSARMKGCLEYLEDPVRGQEEMGRLRREVGIPLATNMCTTDFAEIPSSIALGAEDVILSDVHFWGGFRACQNLAKICAVFGRGFSMHSNSHSGVSMAAMTQLGAAIPNLDFPFDTHYPWQEDEIIEGGKLPIRDGCVRLPDAPGLGVRLDRKRLSEAHDRYVRSGLTGRDDAAEMRKRDPSWRFLPCRF